MINFGTVLVPKIQALRGFSSEGFSYNQGLAIILEKGEGLL